MTNDIVDMERDKRKWPLKPLATGLISRSEAVLYTVILAGAALAIAALAFNWFFTTLLLVALGLSYLYVHYTRDHVGYLTVIPVFACLPVAIWGAAVLSECREFRQQLRAPLRREASFALNRYTHAG